jgi:hypothetical protein
MTTKPIKSSKTLTIETVSNGWIVRPYPDFNQYRGECGTFVSLDEISCYTRIEELQRALPALLGCEPPVVIDDDELPPAWLQPDPTKPLVICPEEHP